MILHSSKSSEGLEYMPLLVNPTADKTLKKKILTYNIMSYTYVRTCGSQGARCLWDICGKPMLYWALKPVLDSPYVNKVIVATEDKKVGRLVEDWGATVVYRNLSTTKLKSREDLSILESSDIKPRSRRDTLLISTDNWTEQVQKYVLYYIAETEGYIPDLMLRCCANFPMCSKELVNRVIETFFMNPEVETAITFFPTRPSVSTWNPILKMIVPLIAPLVDRQLALPLFNISSYILQGSPRNGQNVGVIISKEEGLEVHDEEDLFKAQCYMKRRLERKSRKRKS